MPKRRSLSVSALTKKLDTIFSKFVRLRYADEGGTVSCCTCGRLLHHRDSHASHFVRRQHMAVRWDERNVHASCVKCNVFQGGNLDEYSAFIIRTYGQETFDELLRLKRETKKWTRGELEEMIAHYGAKVRELEGSESPV